MTMKTKNDIEIARRAGMAYTRELILDEDGTWFASVAELPGCMTAGATREEALSMLDDAMAAWIEAALEDDDTIPAPYGLREYSGRFVVRLPQSLHRDLAQRADRERISLNQLIVSELARGQGRTNSIEVLAASEFRITSLSAFENLVGSTSVNATHQSPAPLPDATFQAPFGHYSLF
jgi:antitoxin HicB